MSVISRLTKLEEKAGGGWHVIHGQDENNQWKETTDYCKLHNVNMNDASNFIMWMHPRDVATL